MRQNFVGYSPRRWSIRSPFRTHRAASRLVMPSIPTTSYRATPIDGLPINSQYSRHR